MSGAADQSKVTRHPRLAGIDGRGNEVETAPARRSSVNALTSARRTAATPPRDQRCSCDGGGWIVTLDRDRYKAPGTAEMVRFTRCICLDYASGPARSGGAGAV
jgi:hypothetical protein